MTIDKKDRIELLREALRSRILLDLAKQAGLSYSCLAAIRDGRTKWPRLKTMNLVLPLLGLELEVTHGQTLTHVGIENGNLL